MVLGTEFTGLVPDGNDENSSVLYRVQTDDVGFEVDDSWPEQENL